MSDNFRHLVNASHPATAPVPMLRDGSPRPLRRTTLALLLLILSPAALSVGCAVSGGNGLPELPPVRILILNAATLATAFQFSPYTAQVLTTVGGTPPLTSCTAVAGTLPAGLTVRVSTSNRANCEILTLPGATVTQAPGTYTFTIRAADSGAPLTATQTYTITVQPGFNVNAFTLENGTVGRAFSKKITTSVGVVGGVAPLLPDPNGCTATGLPAGLSIRRDPANANGCEIFGTPTASGTFSVVVTATDSATPSNVRPSAAVTLIINPVLTNTTAALPAGTRNRAYSQTFTATGGQPPRTWSITAGPFTAGVGNAGTPCQGLSLVASTGVLSGTAVNSGTCSFTVRVDDTATATTAAGFDSDPFSIVFSNPAPTLTSIAPAAGNRLQTLNVVFTGNDFFSDASTVSFGAGITVNSTTVNSLTQITANITIASTAALGARDVTVTTAAPGGGTATLTGSFTVSNPAPTLTSIAPTSAERNDTLNVVLTGTNYISGVSSVSFGPNITVNTTTVDSPTQITVNITIAPVAATGARNVSVTNPAPGGGTATLTGGFGVNNPVPAITPPVSPATKIVGEPAFTLTVNGTDFVPDSVVRFAGLDRVTTFVNPTQVTAAIPASDLTAALSFIITVFNPAPGGGTSNPAAFTVNKADTTTTITADTPDPSVQNQGYTVSFTVTVNAPGSGTPTGNVTVSDGTGATCTGALAAGSGSCLLTSTTAGAKTLTATYAGDTNFNPSPASAGAAHTVNTRTTTTLVAFSLNPVDAGQASTVTATVTDVDASGTASAPAGTVTFGSAPIVGDVFSSTTCVLAPTGPAASSCSVTVTPAATGTHNITATYPADLVHSGSADTKPLTVNAAATTVTITGNAPNPSKVSQGYTVNFSVSVNPPGSGTPTGSVTVSDGTGATCNGALTPGTPSTGSCLLTSTTAGAKTLTATYSGDSNFSASGPSAGVAQTVNTRTTSSLVVLGTNPVVVNQGSLATVTVTDTDASGTKSPPSGTMTFGSSVVSDVFSATTCVLAPSGPASSSCAVTVTPAVVSGGSHSITATFPTDTVHTTSNNTQVLTVNARTTSTSVGLSPATVVVNEGSTVTVTVVDTSAGGSPVTPAGTVAVTSAEGTDVITGTCTLAQGANPVGTAQCTATVTPAGVHTSPRNITATFAADTVHATSNNFAALTVNARTTSTAVVLGTNPVVVNQGSLATVTVTDTDAVGTAAVPSGTVTFSSSVVTDGFSSTTCVLAPAGPASASCSVTVTPAAVSGGTHNITATFPTGQVHLTSNNTQALTVNPRTTSTAVAFTPSTVAVNQGSTVTITVTDTDAAGTKTSPDGTVSLSSGVGTDAFTPAASCTLAPSGVGVSTCTATVTPAAVSGGTHTITGNYLGGTAHSASSGNNNLTVTTRATTTSVAFSPTTVAVNQGSTVTVTVTDTDLGTQSSPGVGALVTVSSGVLTDVFTPLAGTCTLAAASANTSTCTVTVTPADVSGGSHTITANFPGTATDTASSGNNNLTVTTRSTTTSVLLAPSTVFVNQGSLATVTVTDTAGGTPSSPGVGTVVAVTSGVGSDVITGTCTLAAATASTSTCSVTVTPAANGTGHLITANFSATAIDSASSGSSTLTVNLRTTTTSVALSPSTVFVNEGSTATVTVVDTAGGGLPVTPSGTVAVTSAEGTDVITGTCTLAQGANPVGTAQCTATVTPAGVHTSPRNITGTFSADTVHAGSSNTAAMTVNLRTTTTSVVLSPATVVVNQGSTATITVVDTAGGGLPVTPSGTVAVTSAEGTDVITGTCTLAQGANPVGTAQCTATVTPAGVHTSPRNITGTFSADSVHAGSSNTAALTVNPRSTATTVGLSPSTVVVNQGSTVTVTVTDNDGAGSAVTPTGTVAVTSAEGTDVITGTCTLVQTVVGTASCTATVTPAGVNTSPRNITGSFSLDDVHAASSNTAALTVNLRATTALVSFSLNPVNTGGATTVTALITDVDANGTKLTPTGNVSFSSTDGADAFSGGGTCALVLVSSSSASCSVTLTASTNTGPHSIMGSYPAGNVHQLSNNTQNLTVQAMVLTPFTLGNATETRTVTNVDIPILGGTGPFLCTPSGGPAGLAVAASGSNCRISGAPNAGTAGSFPAFTITVTDSGVNSDSKSSALTVNASLVVTEDTGANHTETLDNGVTTRTYTRLFHASGGQPPYTFSEVSGLTIPVVDTDCTGLTFNGTGNLGGNTNGAGGTVCTFTIRASDTTATTATVGASTVPFSPVGNWDVALTININNALAINVAPATINALKGSLYNGAASGITFAATGGLTPYQWSLTNAPNFSCNGTTCTGSSFCSGLTLDQTTGQFSGTATTPGACSFDLRVDDDFGNVNQAVPSGNTARTSQTVQVLDTLLYVADESANNQIHVVNTTSPEAEVTTGGPPISVSGTPRAIAIRKDGLRAYVTLNSNSRVAEISTATNAVLNTVDVSGTCTNPRGIAVGSAGNANNRAYVACTNDSVVSLDISVSPPTILHTITGFSGGSGADGIAITPDGSRVYVAVRGQRAMLFFINTNATATSETASDTGPGNFFANGTDLRGALINSAGSRLYLTDVGNDDILIVDIPGNSLNTNNPINLAGGTNPDSLALSQDNSRIWVSLNGTNQFVVVVDSTQALDGSAVTLASTTGVRGIALPPSNTHAYIGVSGAVRIRDNASPFGAASPTSSVSLTGAATVASRGVAAIPIPK